jgi:hypothetical protein
MLDGTVCLPSWLAALLAVGAVGTEVLHQLKAAHNRQNRSGGDGPGSGPS